MLFDEALKMWGCGCCSLFRYGPMLISLRLIYKISVAEFLLKSEKKRPVNKVEDSLGKLLYLL